MLWKNLIAYVRQAVFGRFSGNHDRIGVMLELNKRFWYAKVVKHSISIYLNILIERKGRKNCNETHEKMDRNRNAAMHADDAEADGMRG